MKGKNSLKAFSRQRDEPALEIDPLRRFPGRGQLVRDPSAVCRPSDLLDRTERSLNVDGPVLSQQGPVRIIPVADRAPVRPGDPGGKVQQVVRDGRNPPVEVGGEVAVGVVGVFRRLRHPVGESRDSGGEPASSLEARQVAVPVVPVPGIKGSAGRAALPTDGSGRPSELVKGKNPLSRTSD